MDYEKFNKITSGIQALVLAFAVIVGGCWTLWTFSSLQQVEKAKTEVEQLRRSLRERGVLVITLRPSQIKTADASTHYVLVDVEVVNQGNSSEVIDWTQGGLRVTKVHKDDHGSLAFGPTLNMEYSTPGEQTTTSSILSGQTRRFPFLVPLQGPGIYHIEFEASVMPTETVVHMKEHALVGVTPDYIVWNATTYFNVE
jgi:hypothetical protein